MSVIVTYSGLEIDLLNPNPDSIIIEDIAFALANICRFTGHCNYYSVAEHSIAVYLKCSKKNAFCGLMHDATEAYLGDVSSPLKKLLPEYKKIELNMWKVISKKFNLPFKMPKEVHDVDKNIFFDERQGLQIDKNVNGMPPEEARKMFIKFYEISTRGNSNKRAVIKIRSK